MNVLRDKKHTVIESTPENFEVNEPGHWVSEIPSVQMGIKPHLYLC